MSGELIAVLKERLHKNYEEFLIHLQGKSVPELIAMSAEITAAKQCHEELLDACDTDDVAFLLQFDNPLNVVRADWESEITSCGHRDEMRHILWRIRDRELYFKEQPVQHTDRESFAVLKSQKSIRKKGRDAHER